MILTPSWTQKTSNLGYVFDANLIEFEDDWDKQCIEIIVCVFLSISCYFSSSALVLLVSMDDGKHIYASELQLSPRFPFLCQDRLPGLSKRGSEKEVENSVEKTVPKGPQMDPKSC